MFFLLRAAFWMALVVLLLPADPVDRARDAESVVPAAVEAIGAARSTLRDLDGFCERHGAACDAGRDVLTEFGTRAVGELQRAREKSAARAPATTVAPPGEPARLAATPRGAIVPLPLSKPLS